MIELLVAATIIGILTVIAVISYSSAQKRSRDGKRKADLEAIRGALEMMKTDCGTYRLTAPPWGSAWTELCNSITYSYMQKVPQDPKDPTYAYYYSGASSTYLLCAHLESPSTTDTCSGSCCGTANCGTTGTCNYIVTQP